MELRIDALVLKGLYSEQIRQDARAQDASKQDVYMSYTQLKERHRSERETYHPNLALRTHRALSWLNRAEKSADDLDAQFIFLWIAFNAAYATDIAERYRHTEKKTFKQFFEKIIALDSNNRLYNLVWSEFSQSIRLLLDNKFIFQAFWDYHNNKIPEEQWLTAFAKAKAAANRGLGTRTTSQVLAVIFERIYTLRNQVIHGGATWNSKANRDQIRDCTALMLKAIPILLELMMDNPDQIWGDPFYPFV